VEFRRERSDSFPPFAFWKTYLGYFFFFSNFSTAE
jgi:hypothetical protein